MAKKWNKTMLEAAAEDFNTVIGFEDPIKIGKETTVEKLEANIKDIVENVMEPDDIMSDETNTLIGLMGLELPKASETEPEAKEAKEEAEKVVEQTVEKEVEELTGDKVETEPVEVAETPVETVPKAAGKVEKKKAGASKGEKITRPEYYELAVKELCKKGATKKQIIDFAYDIYVKNGGTSKCKSLGTGNTFLVALLAFGILSEKDNIVKFA